MSSVAERLSERRPRPPGIPGQCTLRQSVCTLLVPGRRFIMGEVDVQNGYGTLLRNIYTCVVQVRGNTLSIYVSLTGR